MQRTMGLKKSKEEVVLNDYIFKNYEIDSSNTVFPS